MNVQNNPVARARFSWYRDDLECKLGLRGSRFTRVYTFVWLIVAVLLTAGLYALMSLWPQAHVVQMLTNRGLVPYIETLVSIWALLMVLMKWHKTVLQRRALAFTDLVPQTADFVLSPATVGQVLSRLHQACDDPGRFILFNRLEIALSNLKNMGQIGDLDAVLTSQATNDDAVMESSYTLIKGLIWAIPVLGFIGTVQGLGKALGGFGSVLNASSDLSNLKPALQEVTAGLSTKFDTTFLALIFALTLTLLLTWVRQVEEEMLDGCKEYCHRYVISRLRLMTLEVVE